MEGSLVFLFAALAITWILIVGYILLLAGRLNALQRELQSLKRRDDWPPDDDAQPPGA